MFSIESPQGAGSRCDWCKFEYSQDRPVGGFMSFADPDHCRGMRTVYGITCCTHCFQMFYKKGAKYRLGLALGMGRTKHSVPSCVDQLSEKHISDAKVIGGYPAEYLTYWESPVSTGVRKVLCLTSGDYKRLSPVNGVHICPVAWSANKGPSPTVTKRQFPLLDKYSDITPEKNLRGR